MEEINHTNLVEDIDFESNSVNAEIRNYKEKLEECIKRVYGYNYSKETRSTKKLIEKIDRSEKRDEKKSRKQNEKSKRKNKVDMNEDIDNIILIAVNHFWLPPYVADRAKLIMARMWSHPDNFHDLKYENVVLGILKYIVDEIPNEVGTPDFNGYCTCMFGTARSERYIIQMYEAYEIVSDIYPDVEREYQELTR